MSPQQPTDRASLLTPSGRGAVAVVAAVGRAAERAVAEHFHAAHGRAYEQLPVGRVVFGHWVCGDHREEVVLVRTGPRALEVHCHGGWAASRRILDAFREHSCAVQTWQDESAARTDSQIIGEADVALASATTRRVAAILLNQRHGALHQAFAAIEASIAAGDARRARTQIDAVLARTALGRRLTQPWLVAIAGPPNVGKSSLLNALVGYQRAIVYDQPGTTRDVLTAETAVDGWPVRLIDAAGIRRAADPLEAEGVARARRQLASADLVLWVVDATDRAEPGDPLIADELQQIPRDRLLRVVNKIDLAPADAATGDLAISALTGQGLDALLHRIAQRIVPDPPPPGAAVPFTPRQVDLLERLARSLP